MRIQHIEIEVITKTVNDAATMRGDGNRGWMSWEASADDEAASPWLGVEATAAAGAALGTSSFGVYELLQRALPKLSNAFFADPGFATAHELELSLASSFGAVLVAAALVAPLEAAKVRLMLSEEPSPPSLRSSLLAVAADGDELRPAKLWDGFYPLLARELPFTTAKLLVYSSAQQALFQLLPNVLSLTARSNINRS